MAKCKILTNSVSDLSPELAAAYDVHVIPDVILFKGREYLNNIDIQPRQLYDMIRGDPVLPSTSHPNLFTYTEHFYKFTDYEEILCIIVSTKMSGSYDTAMQAVRMMEEDGCKTRIYPYDSLNASYGMALQVIRAAELAREGLGAEEIIRELDRFRGRVGAYFCMKTLENARKGGRIGEVKCLTADLLGIKPVLAFQEGTIRDLNLTRSFDKALMRIFRYYQERAKKGGLVFVCHGNNESAAMQMKEWVTQFDPAADVRVEWIGAVIGIFTGEGTIGLVFGE